VAAGGVVGVAVAGVVLVAVGVAVGCGVGVAVGDKLCSGVGVTSDDALCSGVGVRPDSEPKPVSQEIRNPMEMNESKIPRERRFIYSSS
jgi:phage tail tape-measure protein